MMLAPRGGVLGRPRKAEAEAAAGALMGTPRLALTTEVTVVEAWDVIVVGAGVAGLRAALAAAEAGAAVLVLEPAGPGAGQEAGAGSGLAVALNETSIDQHLEDTVRVGGWFVDQDLARDLLKAAPAALAEAESWGLTLRRDARGLPHLVRLPGHATARVAAAGDSTGRRLRERLEEQCIRAGVERRADHPVLSLVRHGAAVRGCVALNGAKGRLEAFRTDALVLAGEDHSSLWGGSGRGQAAMLALDAGLALRDLEHVGANPLCINVLEVPLASLIWGDGARVAAISGQAIDHGATSSAAGIAAAMNDESEGCVLAAGGVDEAARSWFSATADLVAGRAGLDLWTEPVAVSPGPGDALGGLPIDGSGRVLEGSWTEWATGLFAVGGAAAALTAGSDWLPGNALTEALVVGAAAGAAAAEHAPETLAQAPSLTSALTAAEARMAALLASASPDAPTYDEATARAAVVTALSGGMTGDLSSIDTSAAPRDPSPVLNTELLDAWWAPSHLALAQATMAAVAARNAAGDAPQHTLATAAGHGWLPLRMGGDDWLVPPEADAPEAAAVAA